VSLPRRAQPLTAVLLAAPVAFLALAFVLPMASVLRVADAEAWSWVASPYVTQRLQVAALQAVLSAGLALALALPLAWLHHVRRIRASRLQLALHAAPFVLPVFVVVYGLQQTVGPSGWLDAAAGIDLLSALGPLGAVVLAHAYYNYGFAARLLHAALERRPHRLEEAALVLGAPPAAAFLRTTARLLLPAVAGVGLLVFLFAFASFGTVLLLGQGEVSSIETMVYQLLGGVFPNVPRAAALGLLQLALNGALLLGYIGLDRRLRLPRQPERAAQPAGRRMQAFAAALTVVALLPALAVLAGGFRLRGAWSLQPWRVLLDQDHPSHLAGFSLPHAVAVSLGYAAATLALALGLTLLLAYGARRLRVAGRLADLLGGLPLGASSLLLGLGLLLSYGAGSAVDLRGWPGLVVVAHTVVAFPFTARILLPSLRQHDIRLDEAAATLGAGAAATAWRIHRPLLAGPLLAAAGFAAALSLGDYGASLLLMRPDSMGLAVWTLRHDRPFDPLAHAQATALAGLLALLAAACLAAVELARPGALRRSP
jgi:thiamine transport system permease protein